MTRFGSEIRALQRAELKIRTPTSPPRPSPGAEASRIDWGSCEETTSPRQSGGMFPLIHETLPTFTSKFIYREVDEQCLKSVHRGLTAAARGQINPPGGKRKTWVPSEPPRTHDNPPRVTIIYSHLFVLLKSQNLHCAVWSGCTGSTVRQQRK